MLRAPFRPACTRRAVRSVQLLIPGLAALALFAQPESAPRREALVIGNAQYAALPPIQAAHDGADAMAKALRAVNFTVTEAHDLTLTALRNVIEEKFVAGLKPGDVCLVYYSGYGLQQLGVNYFVPVDFDPHTTRDVDQVAYEMGRLHYKLKGAQVSLQMLLIEASWQNAQLAKWASGNGLNSPEGYADTVWFLSDARNTWTGVPATGPGLFTTALVDAVRRPNLNLAEVIRTVQDGVAASSQQQQNPYSLGVGEFYFTEPPPPPPPNVITRLVDMWPVKGSVAWNKDHLNYVYIPKGNFKMGCVPSSASQCQEDENPQHPVEISQSFWLGETETQVAAYRFFITEVKHRKMPGSPDWDRGWKSIEFPITYVTWQDAQDYCAWAGGRLPTEAEWEYAARAGTENQVLPFSDMKKSRDTANFLGKEGYDQYVGAAPSKQFEPNGYGLYDMAGNVWEWVKDFYDPLYYQHSPKTDPQGPASGKAHVARGGSYASAPEKHLRLSFRGHFDGKENHVGFRCLLPDTAETKAQLKRGGR
ncbi:MAG TPA: SUMF1/EgtB/PvdO family nonheme iron enzyme [Bryobacteraceae bacterium]|jgi:sulfatase modifying factor 1|nr:SUMF1/EgtB/PvdO family nonheme iron enzyme [Bryobacteraceae bacterium]